MRKIKPPKLVTVAIFTTVTLIFWVFFSLYNILVTEPEVDVPPKVLEPLDPTLNTNTLNLLPQRVFVEEGEVENFVLPTPIQQNEEVELIEETLPSEALDESELAPTVLPEASPIVEN